MRLFLGGHRETNMERIKWYLVLHLAFFIYAVCSAMGKTASQYPIGSIKFVVIYGGSLMCMCVYALAWQQAIKNLSLTSAYANRAVTVFWGMVFGRLVYHEEISVRQILAVFLIAGGIILYSFAGENTVEDG